MTYFNIQPAYYPYQISGIFWIWIKNFFFLINTIIFMIFFCVLVTFGQFWLILVNFGYFWLLLTIFGYFWLLLVIFLVTQKRSIPPMNHSGQSFKFKWLLLLHHHHQKKSGRSFYYISPRGWTGVTELNPNLVNFNTGSRGIHYGYWLLTLTWIG